MIKNKNRIGRPTSSNAGVLSKKGKGAFGFGDAAITYLNKKKAERFLGRSTDVGNYAKPLYWGKCLEYIAFEKKIPKDYEVISRETIVHPDYKFWSGSPDFEIPGEKVGEIKCYYPDKFFLYSEAIQKRDVAYLRTNFPDEYWQIVSNAILLGYDYGVAMAYMPTREDLEKLRYRIAETDFIAQEFPREELWKFKFISDDEIETLPWISPDSSWPDYHEFEFFIPSDDIIYITQRFIDAEKYITGQNE